MPGKESDFDHDKWDKIYYRFRNQIENENNLYNQRVLWFIYIQAFLFATAGLLLSGNAGAANTDFRAAIDWMMMVVCVLGGYLGLLAFVLLNHAGSALDELREDWTTNLEDIPADQRKYFPHVSGGRGAIRTLRKPSLRQDPGNWKRLLRSRYLPLAFTLAWVLIGLPFVWLAYLAG